MTIPGYEYHDAVPIAVFASHLNPPRSVDCLRKWQKNGVLNRVKRQRVKCEMTRLTNWGWGVSQAQYEVFVAALNEKL